MPPLDRPVFRLESGNLDTHLFHLESLLNLCRETGVEVVLVHEPMSREAPLRPNGELYGTMRGIAEKYDVPVVNAGPVMRDLEVDCFVWWDTAHLAPYDHRTMAWLLEPVVGPLVQERIEKEEKEILEGSDRD